MINLRNVSYKASDRDIFSDVSFSVNKADKIGLVGTNGAGKTTLLKVIAGELPPTSGEIIKQDEEIGILPQDMQHWLDSTVYGFIEEVTGVKTVREEFDKVCDDLSKESNDHTMLLYTDALDRYNRFEVANFEHNLEKALALAELQGIDTSERIKHFSGGQKTRIALSAIFASKYDVVLLDEPTNNLDSRGVVILEKFIGNSNASFVMISHDRSFLRNATTRIIELIGGDKGVRQYGLGYEEYIDARAIEKEAGLKRYEQYEGEKKRLKKAAKEAAIKSNSAAGQKKSTDNDKLNANFRKEKAATGLSRAAKGIDTRIDQLLEPDKPDKDVTVYFDLQEASSKKLNLADARDLMVTYDGNKFFGPISFHVRSGDRLLISGNNGVGKSTIIKTIIGEISAAKGSFTLNKGAGVIYIDQNQTMPLTNDSALSNLIYLVPGLQKHDAIRLLLRFNLNKEIIDTVSAKDISGGERAKTLLAAAVAGKSNLLVMDEPTNNLDIPTIEALEIALKQYYGGVILVSHDREFISNIGITQELIIS